MKQYIRAYINNGQIEHIETRDTPFRLGDPYTIHASGKQFLIEEFEYEDIWLHGMMRGRELIENVEIQRDRVEFKSSFRQPGRIMKRVKRDHNQKVLPPETKVR